MNFNELNTILVILTLLVSLNVPSWFLAIALWIYILMTEK